MLLTIKVIQYSLEDHLVGIPKHSENMDVIVGDVWHLGTCANDFLDLGSFV